MAENKDDLIAHYRAMRADLMAAIDGLSDAQMTEPTIDGWSVKDHLAHMATWDDIRAAEVARISAGHASAWQLRDDLEDAFKAVDYQLRRDLSLEQVRWELETVHRRLLDALAAATPAGLDPTRYGQAGLRSTHMAQHAAWIRRWRSERGL